jgi:hypothetical protein
VGLERGEVVDNIVVEKSSSVVYISVEIDHLLRV